MRDQLIDTAGKGTARAIKDVVFEVKVQRQTTRGMFLAADRTENRGVVNVSWHRFGAGFIVYTDIEQFHCRSHTDGH